MDLDGRLRRGAGWSRLKNKCPILAGIGDNQINA
jgi:hypothetical protein